MNRTINLETYRSKDNQRGILSKVFTGRERGENVRQESKIDQYVKNGDEITIVIPEDIFSINPSFFEEFLFNAVTQLGKEEFFKRVVFKPTNKFTRQIVEAVDRILRQRTALDLYNINKG